jgi:hypothetical protein
MSETGRRSFLEHLDTRRTLIPVGLARSNSAKFGGLLYSGITSIALIDG